jgi:hypothetical protein
MEKLLICFDSCMRFAQICLVSEDLVIIAYDCLLNGLVWWLALSIYWWLQEKKPADA